VVGAVAAGAACGHQALEPAAPNVVPATFAVRLHRASKPGDRGTISSTVTKRGTLVVEEGGQIVKREEENSEVDLKGSLRVNGVDPTGEPVDLELAVESLIVQTPAGRREVLPRGQVVTIARGGEKVRYASADPLSSEAEKALDALVSPRRSQLTDDDVLGTREPQAIGGIWPVNATMAAKELAMADFQISPDDVQGQTRLVGLAEVSGHPCLDVEGELFVREARHTVRDGGAEDPGSSQTYEVRITHRKLLPIDAALPELDATHTIDVAFVITIPAGPGRELRTTSSGHEEKRQRYTPLPRP
jgi:hypothetical protein